MCNDLPDDFSLDCNGDKPEMKCSCCFGCTFVSDEDCDPFTEKMLVLDVFAGDNSDGFEWKLREGWYGSTTPGSIMAAGGDYADGEKLIIQLCLPYPKYYSLSMISGSASIRRRMQQPVTIVCEDLFSKKECIKSSGGECDWDANFGVCVDIVAPVSKCIYQRTTAWLKFFTNVWFLTHRFFRLHHHCLIRHPIPRPHSLQPLLRFVETLLQRRNAWRVLLLACVTGTPRTTSVLKLRLLCVSGFVKLKNRMHLHHSPFVPYTQTLVASLPSTLPSFYSTGTPYPKTVSIFFDSFTAFTMSNV